MSTASSAPEVALDADGVIIDLDGTLLDTIGDLGAAVNGMLAELGRAPIPREQVARFVGKGAEVLVHRSLTNSLDGRVAPELLGPALDAFHRCYEHENGRSARVYDGVREGLAAMRAKGLRLACVTNKPQRFSDALLVRTGLRDAFELVLGGDALPRRKPDPLPLLHVCEHFAIPGARMVAIGDSINDAQAARAAGIAVLLVPYGYNEGRAIESIDADGIVDSLLVAARRIEPTRG